MTTQLSPVPVQRFYDNSGNLAVGGLLYTYAAGTTTPQATYTSSTGATPNANPIVLNSRGECQIWCDPLLNYKYVLTDALSNTLWTVDNVQGLNLSTALSAPTGSSLVGFQLSATGAAAQTIFTKASQTVSVTDFYANGVSGALVDPTGVIDSTLGIQAALNTGKSVYFPPGFYKISAALNPVGSQIIYGAGQNLTFIKASVASQNGIALTNVSWVSIRDLTIQNTASTPTGSAIYVQGGGNNFISSTTLQLFGKGLWSNSGSTLLVDNIYAYQNTGAGIVLSCFGVGIPCLAVWIRNSYSTSNGGDGLLITGNSQGHYLDILELSLNGNNGFETVTDSTGSPADLFCTKIVSDANSQSGYLIGAGTSQSYFDGCWSSNRGAGHNFYCQGTDISINGGKFFNCNGHGMEFLTGTRCSVVGATIQDSGINSANTYDGISSTMNGLTISGCTVFSGLNKTRYGISLLTGATNTSVTGGNLTGNVSGPYSDTSGGVNVVTGVSGYSDVLPWTPSIGGTATYTVQSGSYSITGKQVTVQGKLVVNAIGTGSQTTISGLPFPISGVATGSVGYFSGLSTPVYSIYLQGVGSTLIFNIVNGLTATISGNSYAVLTGGSRVDFTVTYLTP